MRDTTLFHKSFRDAGFHVNPYAEPIRVFNNKHKSGETRRIKLYDGNGVFQAPQFIQEALEAEFKRNFGERYLGGQFIARKDWYGQGVKSFVIYLLA